MNETVTAWVVTFSPDQHIKRAIGPDDPDEEQAVLLFLTVEAATNYVVMNGWLGADIVEVEVRRKMLPPKPTYAPSWRPRPPVLQAAVLQAAVH